MSRQTIRARMIGTTVLAMAGAISAGSLAAMGAAEPKVPVLPEFTLLVYEAKSEQALRGDAAKAHAYWQEYADYFKLLAESGVYVSGSAIEPVGLGREVRIKAGRTEVVASRMNESQPLGGYFVIRAADLEAAAAWAAKCPAAATGVVEIRPNVPMNPAAGSMKDGGSGR